MPLTPCTGAVLVKVIPASGMKIQGIKVVVFGHSEILGKPAALMLMAEGATVYMLIRNAAIAFEKQTDIGWI